MEHFRKQHLLVLFFGRRLFWRRGNEQVKGDALRFLGVQRKSRPLAQCQHYRERMGALPVHLCRLLDFTTTHCRLPLTCFDKRLLTRAVLNIYFRFVFYGLFGKQTLAPECPERGGDIEAVGGGGAGGIGGALFRALSLGRVSKLSLTSSFDCVRKKRISYAVYEHLNGPVTASSMETSNVECINFRWYIIYIAK